MSEKPTISVIMPVYNMGNYIVQSLESVLRQSLSNIEIMCVDDCSTDNSAQIIKSYQKEHSNIRYHKMDQNSGSGPCRNKGMELATGEYIAFLDPDDLFAEDALQTLYKTAKETGQNIVGGNLLSFHDDDPSKAKDFGKATFEDNKLYSYANDYPFSVGYYRFIYKREFIQSIEVQFPPLRRYQDPPWFVQVMMQAKEFYGLSDPVYLYRQSHQKITKNHDVMNHILTGVLGNLKRFRTNDLQAHYAREQKELGYYLYGFIYSSLPKGIEFTTETIGLIRYHAQHSEDLSWSWAHIYKFLRYGLTLMKLNALHYKNKKKAKRAK